MLIFYYCISVLSTGKIFKLKQAWLPGSKILPICQKYISIYYIYPSAGFSMSRMKKDDLWQVEYGNVLTLV